MISLDRLLRRLYYRLLRSDPLKEYIKRGLVIGTNVYIEPEATIDYSHAWLIEIGNDVTLAPYVHIFAHDASTRRHVGYTRIGKVRIGNRVFIGTGSIVLPGVTIGDDVIIGAGSVVTHDIPNGQVAAGNPARTLCSIADYEKKTRERMSRNPCFGKEYKLNYGVTDDMKQHMKTEMKSGIGYIV
ncbi:MAG: DapH/DapD/GlmU-related protein [Gaiellaceae bacterium]|jgi:maltose O-acetyltransferase